MKTSHEAYRATQDSIYNKIQQGGSELGVTTSLRNDVKEPQGAYLVAWRHPESITRAVGDVSHAVAEHANALTYDETNLHTTLSDYGLAPELIINPEEDFDQKAVLEALVKSVKAGLDNAGRRAIAERQIAYDRYATNGGSVIAPGQANDEVLDIRSAVLEASAREGVPLKGSWGNHMTVNRFTGTANLEAAAAIMSLLNHAPKIGTSAPTSIDVGYLQVDPDKFTYTTHTRFPLDRE